MAKRFIGGGTIDINLDASEVVSGTLNADRVPSLDAAKIASGTIDSARLPTKVVMSGRIGSTATPSLSAPYKVPFNDFFTQSGITYDSVNRRFYMTVDGVYRITFNALKEDDGVAMRIIIGVNTDAPTQSSNIGQIYANADVGKYDSVPIQTVTSLSAGDYVVFYVQAGAIYNSSIDRYGHFSIEKID